jgi:hypothetical protein
MLPRGSSSGPITEDAAWFPEYSGSYQIERLKVPLSAELYPALHVFDVGRNK